MIKNLGLIAVIISIISPIIGSLIYCDKIKISIKEKNGWILLFVVVSTIAFIALLSNSSQVMAESKNLTFPGKVIKEKVFVEGDGETVDHFEDIYKFYPANGIVNEVLEISEFIILIFLIGGLAININFWLRHSKDERGEKIETTGGTYLIVIKLVVATSLIVCLLPMPSWYYDKIRLIVPVGCIYISSRQIKNNNFFAWFFFVAVAILFNPIWEIHFPRLTWNVIDVIVAIILMASAVKEYIDKK